MILQYQKNEISLSAYDIIKTFIESNKSQTKLYFRLKFGTKQIKEQMQSPKAKAKHLKGSH